MKISVVIPAYNEEKLLGATLHSIGHAVEAFRERGWDVETVVCDNNSTDRTAEIAQEQGARVVFEPVNQIGRARNQGAAAAAGDWIVFVDADSHPSIGLFRDVAAAIASGRYIAGGSTVRLDTWFPIASTATACWNIVSRFNKWLAGSFIFCEAAAFRAIGGFSHAYYVSEEIDLSRRLKALAKKRKRKMVVLRGHPLVTSARKMRLYSYSEYFQFFFWMFWQRGRTVHEREKCPIWYDGRR
jgi:glycosyltransferase involved in cell wall biosynthesis